MEYQRENEGSFKSVKNHFKVHTYQKFLTLAGLGASVVSTLGMHNMLVSAVEWGGVVGGGLALKEITGAEKSVAKSMFLLLGGCALGFVASTLPFSHILHQVTSTITTAGAAGLIEKKINSYNKKKMGQF